MTKLSAKSLLPLLPADFRNEAHARKVYKEAMRRYDKSGDPKDALTYLNSVVGGFGVELVKIKGHEMDDAQLLYI